MHLVFITKPVARYCNLNCTYCFYRNDKRDRLEIMSNEVLKTFIREALEFSPDRCDFIWHGGEPMVAGIDFFKQAIYYQNLIRKNGQIVENMLQTNGTLISKDWIDFFKENNFSLGISLDGSKIYHDFYRRDKTNRGSFEKVKESINLLKKEGIGFGVLAVITKVNKNSIYEILNFFVSLGIKSFAFNYAHEFDSESKMLTNFSIGPRDYYSILNQLFDSWLNRNDYFLRIRDVDEPLTAILGKDISSCRYSGSNMCKSIITIDNKGDIFPCDYFYEEKWKMGNILQSSIKEIFESNKFKHWIKKINSPWPECDSCEWYFTCKGGCPWERFFYEKKLGNKDVLCSQRKKFFSHILNKLEQITNSKYKELIPHM